MVASIRPVWAFFFLVVTPFLVPRAFAQATANVFDTAEDAFGSRHGDEAIGIYSERTVRGFNLEAAGNYRIDGRYFVKSSGVSRFFVEQTNVRIGYNTLSLDFPGPSGVVDYSLRDPDLERPQEVTVGINEFERPFAELFINLRKPKHPVSASIGMGMSLEGETKQGATSEDRIVAGIVRLDPDRDTVIRAFGGEYHYEQEAAFSVLFGPDATKAPRAIPRRRYLGQTWAVTDGEKRIAGVLADKSLDGGWRLAADAVFSEKEISEGFTQFFTMQNDADRVRSSVAASPPQRSRALSGEVSIAWQGRAMKAMHDVALHLRLRRSENLFGGEADIDLGETILGTHPVAVAAPDLTDLDASKRDEIDQWGVGLSYQALISDDLRANLGILKTNYEKSFVDEVSGAQDRSSAGPILYNAGIAYRLLPGIEIYGSYSRGLEEAGVAPASAANANSVLPAGIAVQKELGIKAAVTRDLVVLFAGFETEKPLPGIDPTTSEYRLIGDVRHRGLELSVSGSLGDEISIVSGGAWIDARASGPEVGAGLIGSKPVGVPELRLITNAIYTPTWIPGLSLDGGIEYTGIRAARGRLLPDGSQIDLPGFVTVDLGLRYRLPFGYPGLTLRAQARNVGNAFAWTVNSAEALDYQAPRAFRLVLTSEF